MSKIQGWLKELLFEQTMAIRPDHLAESDTCFQARTIGKMLVSEFFN